MKKILAVGAVLATCFSTQVLADTNIAQGKTVTLSGTFGTDPDAWSSLSPVPAAHLTDGLFEVEGTQWDFQSVWWNQSTHPEDYALIDLGGLFKINSFVVQADDNDTYRLEYRVGGGAWQTAWDVPTIPSWGLVTRSTSLGSPILADELRFTSTGGDAYRSVSEIQAFGVAVANPVPEPETYAMMMAGLGLMGFMARRRKKA